MSPIQDEFSGVMYTVNLTVMTALIGTNTLRKRLRELVTAQPDSK